MTTREPLYTDQDRAELYALAEYRAGLCPACAGPLEECTSHEATGPKFRASWTLCRRREQSSIAQKASEFDHPEAQIWSVTAMRR